MKKSSHGAYLQSIVLRDSWRELALNWPGARSLMSIHVPLSDPDALALIGKGNFFETFMRGTSAFCFCFALCDPEEKEKDLSPLVEYLRRVGA